MTYVQLFHKLDTPQKDAFCDNLLTLGLVSELNPTVWNKTIKAAIKGSKGTVKKLYKAFKPLEPAQRSKFFQSMVDEARRQDES